MISGKGDVSGLGTTECLVRGGDWGEMSKCG